MKQEFCLICPNIRSLYNIGSIFRTADAAGIDKIFLTGYSGKPPNPKIEKVALGATKTVLWQHHWQTWRVIEDLKKKGFTIIALEQTKKSINYKKFKPKFPIALVIGNEVRGISKNILKRCDKIIHLPMSGKKESLNVAVALGIAVYKINEFR